MAPQKLFCWTVCAYRKPGMSEEDYHKYMSEVHAPLVRDLMVKYGIVSWEMVRPFTSPPSKLTQENQKTHNTSQTRLLMSQIAGPQFNGVADYDCIVQATFRDIEDFVRMKADPYYKEKVAPDHENFADTKRSK